MNCNKAARNKGQTGKGLVYEKTGCFCWPKLCNYSSFEGIALPCAATEGIQRDSERSKGRITPISHDTRRTWMVQEEESINILQRSYFFLNFSHDNTKAWLSCTSMPILHQTLWRAGPGEVPGLWTSEDPDQSCLHHVQPASCGQKPPLCSNQHFRQAPHWLHGLGASNAGSQSYGLYQSSLLVSFMWAIGQDVPKAAGKVFASVIANVRCFVGFASHLQNNSEGNSRIFLLEF